MEDYYLAERRLPWWALSLADLSSYIDIAGTMINTALVYAMGAACGVWCARGMRRAVWDVH